MKRSAYLRMLDTPWAITEAALQQMLEIANRENESLDVVASRMGRDLDNTYAVEMRGDVAVLPVTGPLFRYANLFTSVSGATSYERIAQDFTAAMEDPNVSAIVLNIDSPGGQLTGCSELADMIFSARGTKPIIAYVGGAAGSGAYWIAAAADEIVCADTAEVGCLGVQTIIEDRGDASDTNRGVKTYRFVSSQTPNKNAGPGTEIGAKNIQARVDAAAQIFVEKIAQFRGEDLQTVIDEFGKGAMIPARQALADGLADSIGSFEGVIAALSNDDDDYLGMAGARGLGANSTTEGDNMKAYLTSKAPSAGDNGAEVTAASISQHCPEVATALRKEGVDGAKAGNDTAMAAAVTTAKAEGTGEGIKAERARIAGIMGHAEAKGREATALKIASTTDLTVEAAGALLAGMPKAKTGEGFKAAMDKEAVPAVGGDAEPAAEGDVQAWASGLVEAASKQGVIRQ